MAETPTLTMPLRCFLPRTRWAQRRSPDGRLRPWFRYRVTIPGARPRHYWRFGDARYALPVDGSILAEVIR